MKAVVIVEDNFDFVVIVEENDDLESSFEMIPSKMKGELVPYDQASHPSECTLSLCEWCWYFQAVLPISRCQQKHCKNRCCSHKLEFVNGHPVCTGCFYNFYYKIDTPNIANFRNLIGELFKNY